MTSLLVLVTLLRPLSGARVESPRPLLKWKGAGAVTIEICRDRACAQVIETIKTSDDHATPKELPKGVVYWRVEKSPARPLYVGAAPAFDAKKLTPPEKTKTFGASVAEVGDVNGDGVVDWLVGAPGVNAAYLYAAGATTPWLTLTKTSKHEHASFGVEVGAAGDLDGDGYPDFFVTASGNNLFYVYRGGATPATEPWFSLFGGGDTQFASSMCGCGDLDGDGRADLAFSFQPDGEGEPLWVVRWIRGADKLVPSKESLKLGDDLGFLRFTPAGDLNNDGYDDFTVTGERGGKPIVVHGGPRGPHLIRSP